MKKIFMILVAIIVISIGKIYAQNDTIKNESVNLLNDLMTQSDQTNQSLLPEKMVFTQRILWGQKGLMRNFNTFNLTPEEREKELKIRRTMLVSHQVAGFTTLLCMIGQGVVGSKLYNGNYDVHSAHEALATAINIGYFTTASLSLFAPPKMIDERKGYSSIKVHKWLAVVHMTGMITTNILAGQLESNPDLKPYHRAAAFTTFGAFAASMIVIKF